MANVRDGVTRLPKPVVEEIVPSSGWTEDSNGHYLLVDLPGFKKNQVKVQISNSKIIKINGERPVNENKHIRFEQNFTVPENSDLDGIKAKFDGEILYITVPKHKAQEEKKEPEPAGVKDQGIFPKHETEEKKEPEPVGTKGQDVVPKHKTEEKREPEPEPVGSKVQGYVPMPHEISAKKKPEPAGTKDEGVNGTTEENIHKKPNDNETETKDDSVVGNGQQVCTSKKKEGIHKNAPMSFSEDTVRRWEGEPSYLGSGIKMLKNNKGIVVTAVIAVALGIVIFQKFKANEK